MWAGDPVKRFTCQSTDDLGWFDLPEASRMPLAHGATLGSETLSPAIPLNLRVAAPAWGATGGVCEVLSLETVELHSRPEVC